MTYIDVAQARDRLAQLTGEQETLLRDLEALGARTP